MSTPTTSPSMGHEYLPHKQIMVILSGLLTGLFLAALDQSIVATALPKITSDLGGLDRLSWVVTAYLLASTASTPLWGKISDIYGRRLMFQIAIVVFIVGSLAAGFAATMEQLIVFRAVQGLGGGGLIALTMATIGDIIPPRERGRYQGYVAAVFGTSSVLGPVLGGFFADGPGWEWIFFINGPIGLVAFLVVSSALKGQHVRREHRIDYAGAALIVASVSCLLLYTSWAGPERGWSSGLANGLLIGGLILAVVFVAVELRAAEPILPMELFSNQIFRVATSFTFLTGVAMFGSMIFMPIYLQVVGGLSPTESGLGMLPMVFGMFSASMLAGQYMSRTGRYRWIPTIGACVTLVGLVLLASLQADSPYWFAGIAVLVLGWGLGLTMQVMVVITQNSVAREEIGVATSSVQFFRQMGGSFGAALFGVILTSRLTTHLNEAFAGNPPADSAEIVNDVDAIAALPEPTYSLVTGAFSHALQDMFWTAVPIVVIALVIGARVKEIPLATRAEPPVTNSAQAPVDPPTDRAPADR